MGEGQLKGLIPRTRELGRLRMGEKGTKQNARGQTVSYPVKRTTWRLTSPSPDLLAKAAEEYGGGVEVWTDAPTQGRQYELATECEALDVMIPLTDNACSQAFELWSGGGCQRRCDGERMADDSPCVCPADIEARMAAAAANPPTACKPFTRFNVLLPNVPDLGFWRLETHGYNAAVELPGSLHLFAGLARQMGNDGLQIVRAQLAIEARTSKKDGQTRHYTVPVIRVPQLTPAAILGGSAPQIGSGPPTALEAGAVQSVPDSPPPTAPPPDDQSDLPPNRRPFTDDDATLAPVAWQRQFIKAAAGLSDVDLCEVVDSILASRNDPAILGQPWKVGLSMIRKDETDAAMAALRAAKVVA